MTSSRLHMVRMLARKEPKGKSRIGYLFHRLRSPLLVNISKYARSLDLEVFRRMQDCAQSEICRWAWSEDSWISASLLRVSS